MKGCFNVRIPQEIVWGENAIKKLKEPGLVSCKKAAIFTDQGVYEAGLTEKPKRLLLESGCEVEEIRNIPAEPSYQAVQEVLDCFLDSRADLIVAVGGGSVMDTAKLASVATREEKVIDYLDTPLLGKKRVKSIMVPTTAGTGSEATPNSIVLVPEKELKVGIVNPQMVADMVILDGNMIRFLPERIAAATGMDALAHALECFTSKKANAFSNMYALEALKLIFENLVEACKNPDNINAKNEMLLAAFYGGVAIAASGTTAVHALSYPLGGRYHIAHGVSNAMLLAPVMRYNQDACVEEFSVIYDAVCGRNDVSKDRKSAWLIKKIEDLVKELGIPVSLKEFGIGAECLEDLVKAGMEVQRLLQNNKKTVTAEDARKLYQEIM